MYPIGENGQAPNKVNTIELANDLIAKTEFQEKVAAAKKLRHLKEEMTLGSAWYHRFLKHHAALLTKSGTVIKDVKRRTWVTCKNFETYQARIHSVH